MTDAFSLMTFNIRFGLAKDGDNAWDRRKHVFGPLLAAHPADFVCVQEANGFQADHLAKILPAHRFIGRRDPAPDFWQHDMIFYHESWSLLGWDHFYLSLTPNEPSQFEDSRWPRQCAMGRFERNGRVLAVCNTHFDFFESARVKSARLILARLDAFAPKAPAILAGDFNTGAQSPCFKIFAGAEGGEGPFFRDALAPEAKDVCGTHHGFTGVPDPRIGRIDWILFRGPLDVVFIKTLTDSFSGQYPSDHFPVLACFSWKDA